MENGDEDILSQKNATAVLVYLLKHGPSKKTDLSEVSTMHTIDKLLPLLEKEGFIVVKEMRVGRRIYDIVLTSKGKDVAEQLMFAIEAVYAPKNMRHEQAKARVYAKKAEEWKSNFNEATKGLSMLYHVNVMEDHVTIGERTATGERVINIYVKVNGHGILRLWCEEDESFECVHVQYAWTLPDVQEMYFNQVKSGNVRR